LRSDRAPTSPKVKSPASTGAVSPEFPRIRTLSCW
jgi:hypothetical protein